MQFRIGARDGVTGLYEVIWPDDGVTLNGIKIFNAEYRVGNVVRGVVRSDGMIILDGPVASATSTPVPSAPLSDRDRGGYLGGQVFNEDEQEGVYVGITKLVDGPIYSGVAEEVASVRISRAVREAFVVRVVADYGGGMEPNTIAYTPQNFQVFSSNPLNLMFDRLQLSVPIGLSVGDFTDLIPELAVQNRSVRNLGVVRLNLRIDGIFKAGFGVEENLIATGKFRVRGDSVTLMVLGQVVDSI